MVRICRHVLDALVEACVKGLVVPAVRMQSQCEGSQRTVVWGDIEKDSASGVGKWPGAALTSHRHC